MTAFATVNGMTLHYTLDGAREGQPLVLIHSLGTDLRLWDAMIPLLGAFRILRFDLRGHGLSDNASSAFTIDDLAADVRLLLDLVRIDTAVIVGISVGGLVAMNFAIRSPERVASLVLCDTAARIGSTALWSDRIASVQNHGIAPIAGNVVARWFAPDFAGRQPAVHRGYTNLVTRTSDVGYIQMCEVLRDTDLTQSVGAIRARTLVACGALDVSTPPAQAQQLAHAILNARYVEFANAAHLPPVEQPAPTAAVITRFIEENANVG